MPPIACLPLGLEAKEFAFQIVLRECRTLSTVCTAGPICHLVMLLLLSRVHSWLDGELDHRLTHPVPSMITEDESNTDRYRLFVLVTRMAVGLIRKHGFFGRGSRGRPFDHPTPERLGANGAASLSPCLTVLIDQGCRPHMPPLCLLRQYGAAVDSEWFAWSRPLFVWVVPPGARYFPVKVLK